MSDLAAVAEDTSGGSVELELSHAQAQAGHREARFAEAKVRTIPILLLLFLKYSSLRRICAGVGGHYRRPERAARPGFRGGGVRAGERLLRKQDHLTSQPLALPSSFVASSHYFVYILQAAELFEEVTSRTEKLNQVTERCISVHV